MSVRFGYRLNIDWRGRLATPTPLGHREPMRKWLLIGGVLAVLCAAVAVLFITADEDAPPRLDADLVTLLARQGFAVVPDDSATREREEDARSLASRYGPSGPNTERRVVAVSLARVTDTSGHDFGDDLVWVVVVENVVWHCFGDACVDDGEPTATEVVIVNSESLDRVYASVF